jgi:hypothetical protein
MWGAVLGTAGEIATTAMANQANRKEAERQRAWSEKQATTAWERQMGAANTAHQRQVNDMRKAGLNPILAVGGKGATTPNAPMPQGQKADMKKAELAAAAATAMQVRERKVNADLTAEKGRSEKLLQKRTQAETNLINEQTQTNAVNRELQVAQTKRQMALIARDEAIGKVFTDASQLYDLLKNVSSDKSIQEYILNFLKETQSNISNSLAGKVEKMINDSPFKKQWWENKFPSEPNFPKAKITIPGKGD